VISLEAGYRPPTLDEKQKAGSSQSLNEENIYPLAAFFFGFGFVRDGGLEVG
jgi:hypothetical protein